MGSWPVPDFEPSLYENCGPTDISFENRSFSAQLPLSYLWNFGNGTPVSTDIEPSTFYENQGVYTIELTATNSYGCARSIAKSIEIYPQPMALFEVIIEDPCNPAIVTFINLTTDSTFTDAFWDFGDGESLLLAGDVDTVTHIYENAGLYQVSLQVDYLGLCEDGLIIQDAVEVKQTPIPDFSWEPILDTLYDKPSGMVRFTDESMFGTSYRWDFGDSSSSFLQNPIHQYVNNYSENRDSFMVTLTVFNAFCEASITKKVIPNAFGTLYVPNAFAPRAGSVGGDGRYFMPKGRGIETYHMRVFDLYGNMVWESTALEDGSPAEFWDGNVKGVLVNNDAFVWHLVSIRFQGDRPYLDKRQGTITLIR